MSINFITMARKRKKSKKIASLNDIRFAKERYRYDAKIYDQALAGSLSDFKNSLGENLQNPMRMISQDMIFTLVMNGVSRWRR